MSKSSLILELDDKQRRDLKISTKPPIKAEIERDQKLPKPRRLSMRFTQSEWAIPGIVTTPVIQLRKRRSIRLTLRKHSGDINSKALDWNVGRDRVCPGCAESRVNWIIAEKLKNEIKAMAENANGSVFSWIPYYYYRSIMC